MSVDGQAFLVDAQHQSPLLRLPAELRRHIYAYIVPEQAHLFHDERGNIRAATCVTPSPSSADHYCFDRRSLGDPSTAVWARRLRSPWGRHWRCEEVAKRLHRHGHDGLPQHDAAVALMNCCRRTYDDVASLLADTSVIHINELATLDLLFDKTDSASSRPRSPGHLLTRAFSHARRLDLALRLQLSTLEAIAAKPQPTRAAPPSPDASPSPQSAWIRLWRNMTTLRSLRRVDITLDHDSESSWSGVDELALLGPLQPLASHPTTNTTIHLPKAASPTHAHHNDPSPGLPIQRFTRQRFFTEDRKDGTIGLVYEEDAYKSFHGPGPRAAEMLRAAELTMHVWFQGVELDYAAMEEMPDGDGETGCDAL
ncbi:hypothetical protein E4U41_005504 [Claviceps citrina]|nr:hypothetical protein E4U41_005504 [Claviceps citrina]